MKVNSKTLVHTINRKENLIFNGYTGELDIVNTKVAELLRKKDARLDDLTQEEIVALQESYYIVEDEEKLAELVYSNYQKYLNENKDKDVDIFVICPTLDCNLTCPYCFERFDCNRNESMTDEMLLSVFEFIQQFTINRGRKGHVSFFGGEPLLEKNYEVDKKIFEFLKKYNMTCDIVTNGSTIDSEKIYHLIKDNCDIITNIQVSMDGTKKYHDKMKRKINGSGTFDLVIDNIYLLLEMGIDVNVRINISKNNVDEISEISNFFEMSKLGYFEKFKYYFAPVTNSKNIDDTQLLDEADLAICLAKENLVDKCELPLLGYIINSLSESKIMRLPAYRRCEANRYNYFVFSTDGYIYPCMESLGDIKFAKMKYFPKYEKCEENENYVYENILEANRPDCANCSIALLCGGGCIRAKRNCKNYCVKQKETVFKYLNYLREVLGLE